MYYVFVILSLAVAGELEVSGSLKVSEGIDAQGQTISNVGSAVLDSDATNLSTVRSMMGMKPTRIYSTVLSNSSSGPQEFPYTVPDGKIWIPSFAGNAGCLIQLAAITDLPSNPSTHPIVLFPGRTLLARINGYSNGILTIYEFPFSSSGTEQGLDFIEP